MRPRIFGGLPLLLAMLAPGVEANTPVPVGNQTQINTYTTGSQLAQSVAVRADGSFVVVWHSGGSNCLPGNSSGIHGQRFNSAGALLGSEFLVDGCNFNAGTQRNPSVAADTDGGFVVVWESYGLSTSDTSYGSIQGQRFDSAGAPIGARFQANTYTTDGQRLPALDLGAGGDFVVVWLTGNISGSLHGRHFDSAGSPTGDEFLVSTDGSIPAVADTADGFVVVWQRQTISIEIEGQLFDSEGMPMGDSFLVNTYQTSEQASPAVASDADGNFVVVWSSDGSSGSDAIGSSIQGRGFDSAGTPVGGQFQVNTYTSGNQTIPDVAVDSDGGFVVVWEVWECCGLVVPDIHGQSFDSAGSQIGSEFQVNSYTTDRQRSPEVSVDDHGRFVVVWASYGSSGSDLSGYSIQGQRYQSQVLFGDGFESGDTSAWGVE